MKLKKGSKIKMPTLEKLVKKCLKEDLQFNLSVSQIEIYGNRDEFYFEKDQLGKTIEVKSVDIERFGSPAIFTDVGMFGINELEFSTGKKISAINKQVDSINRGDVLSDYEIRFFEDHIQVGCQQITKEKSQKLFKVLGKYLGYKIEG